MNLPPYNKNCVVINVLKGTNVEYVNLVKGYRPISIYASRMIVL